ncbi:MAG: flavodoxin domain-containing protein [Actinobacteria bacterium]|nr:flavodoxin domain-containing protein [Actinomycetota bacterium]
MDDKEHKMARVLVGYGTKMGGTTAIAERIGEVLREQGHDATVVEAGKARLTGDYDAAVIGSALYAGMWRGPAKRLVKTLARKRPEMPLWLFHSGPLGEEQEEKWQAFPKWLRELEGSLDVRDKATFGGVLDHNAKGFIATKMFQDGRGGDFRDMEQIAAWAAGIAAAL